MINIILHSFHFTKRIVALSYSSTICLGLVIFFSLPAYANNNINLYPEEFSDFFTEVNQDVEITIAGVASSVTISGLISYEQFRLEAESDGIAQLKLYLEQHFLTPQTIEEILNDAVAGFRTDADCKRSLARCVLPTVNDRVRYVFDFDHYLVRIFVSPESVTQPSFSDKSYASAINHHYGLLNWSNLNLYSNFTDNSNIDLSNLTTVGLPLGYIELDSNYTSDDNSLSLYSAKYDVDYNALRMQASYSSYNQAINSTDALNEGAYFRGFGLVVGSSRNLLKGSSTSENQQIFFYAPSNGRLQVYRDERLILSKNVTEGQQSILYSELPKGVYEISYQLMVGDEVVLEDRRQIINSDQFSLASGEFDFLLGGGVLTDNTTISTTPRLIDDFSESYLRGALAYRATEQLVINSGVVGNADTLYGQLGGLYLFDQDTKLQLLGGYSLEQDWYTNIRFNWGRFYSNYQRFYAQTSDKSEFIRQLYKSEGLYNFNLGISYPMGPAFTYINYSLYSNYSSLTDSNTDSDYLTAGLTMPLLGGTLTLNAGYNDLSTDRDGSWNISTSWSYSFFESNITSQVSVDINQDGFSRNSNYLRSGYDGEHRTLGRYNISGAVGGVIEPDQVSSNLSANFNATNDYGYFNGYGYVTNQKQNPNSVTMGWSGGQVLDSTGLNTTNRRANAYLAFDYNETKKPKEEGSPLHLKYYTSRDQQAHSKGDLIADKTLLVPINNYQAITTKVEGDGSSIVQNGTMSMFTKPGSIYRINPDVTRVDSLIVVLDDIYGDPIRQIQCLGTNCVSVEPLSSDGVFRINFKVGSTPRIISLKGLCFFDKNDSSSKYYKGYCLPGVDISTLDSSEETYDLLEENFGEELVLYLGSYQEQSDLDKVLADLNSLGIAFKAFTLGEETYLYVIHDDHFTDVQKSLLKKLGSYVLLRDHMFDVVKFVSEHQSLDGV